MHPERSLHGRLPRRSRRHDHGALGHEASFRTTGPPAVSEESFHGIGTKEGAVAAQINSNGRVTTYRVEYGPTSAYGSRTEAASLGGLSTPRGVERQLS